MIYTIHRKGVFFLVMLISLCISSTTYSQIQQTDTLKKSKTDSLSLNEETEEVIEEKINYTAEDSIVAMPQIGKAFLYGKAKIDYGSMNIEADFLELDYAQNLVKAYGRNDSLGKPIGNPSFKDGDQEMTADTIKYNLKTKKGKIYNAWTKQGELLVYGSQIKKDSTNITYFKNMKCILCKDADARTIFIATRAKVIPNDKIITGPMYLEIGGVPTPLGLPFGYFPNSKKQHNGILLPTVGNSRERGFFMQNAGFYWGINDKTDMVIRGDAYANGSWLLKTTNTYNVLYKSNGLVSLDYGITNIGDRDLPDKFSKQRSYSVIWTHAQDNRSNPSQRFSANVNYRNNQNINRLNATDAAQFLTNTFQSNIMFSKDFKFGSLSLNATHAQNAIDKSVEMTFPSITFNVNRFFPFKRENAVKQNVLDKIGVNYVLTAQNTLRGFDSTILKKNPEENYLNSISDRLRYGVKHSIPISTNFNVLKYITVTPGINLNAWMYTKTIEKNYQNYFIDERNVFLSPNPFVINNPNNSKTEAYRFKKTFIQKIDTSTVNGFRTGYDAQFSTSLNTKIYFDYLFKKGRTQQIRHLLIPTITYSYRPDFGEEKYGFFKRVQTDTLGNTTQYSVFENGIYGGPAPGKSNAIGVNLNNTIDAKLKQKTDTGFVYKKVSLLQNLGISGNYNFAAERFKMSDISVAARTVLFKNINVNAGSTFNTYAYDKDLRAVINTALFDKTNQLARLTNANFAVSTAIGSSIIDEYKKSHTKASDTESKKFESNDFALADNLPWNIDFSYILNLTNLDDTKLRTEHTLNFNGNFQPTKFWTFRFTSGFDFIRQKISFTRVDITRDLKCWQATIGWVPFGISRSYNVSINLKMSMLSEFKIPRQRQWFDNIQ